MNRVCDCESLALRSTQFSWYRINKLVKRNCMNVELTDAVLAAKIVHYYYRVQQNNNIILCNRIIKQRPHLLTGICLLRVDYEFARRALLV